MILVGYYYKYSGFQSTNITLKLGVFKQLYSAMKTNIIAERSFAFALSIIRLYQELQERREYVLSKQILRSGTSIGANVQEATAAFSKKDFAYRMSIASKETRETHYWLRLLNESQLVDLNLEDIMSDIREIDRILTSIVKTCHHRNF